MSDQRQPTPKVPSPVNTGNWAAPEHGTGTASPLERNPRSHKGWKKREFDGVGLGIVAALEKADRPSKIIAGAQKAAPIAIVPPRKEKPSSATGDFQVADFLSCCYLCRKRLHGKDIFMYRGEKAFCSMECRYQQIVSDECVEKFGSGALRSSNISNSPCSIGRSQLFFTGIMAA